LKKGFTGLVIQGLGPILPDLIDLTAHLVKGAKATIPMVKGMVAFLKETKLLQAVLMVLTAKGFGMLLTATGKWVTKLGGLGGVLARVAGFVWKTLVPLLLLEDLLVFMSGGDSAFGS